MHKELRFYCQRRGNEGNAGDRNLLRIRKLLIAKSLLGSQKPMQGSNLSLSAKYRHLATRGTLIFAFH